MNLHRDNHEYTPASNTSLPRRVATHRAIDEVNQDKSTPIQEETTNVVSKAQQSQATEVLFTLTIPEVRARLIDAGHPVSERTVIRWCAKNLLNGILRPEENGQYEKYYVNKESVAKKIGELNRVRPSASQAQQETNHVEDNLDAHPVKTQHGVSDNSSAVQSTSENPEVERDPLKNEYNSLKQEKLNLEAKLMNAEIEKQAAHHVRDHLAQQNTTLIEELQNRNYALGNAEGRLQLLDATKEYCDEEISSVEPAKVRGIRKLFFGRKQ